MKLPELFIFDIGGVLLRTDDPAARLELAADYQLDRVGIDRLVFGSEVARQAELGLRSEQDVWEHVRSQLGLSEPALADFQQRFWAGDCADEGLFAWLAGLPDAIHTCLLTNSWLPDPLSPFWLRWGLPETLVRSAVDGVVSSARAGVRKPDARIFRLVLDQFGVEAETAVFVDDFEENIRAAEALGLRGVWFRSREKALAELNALLA